MCNFAQVIITASPDEVRYMQNYTDYKVVAGGETRAQSLQNALQAVESEYVMVTDTARACIPQKVITELYASNSFADCVVPYIKVADTALYGEEYLNRDAIKLIQTPQLSRTDVLKKALGKYPNATDESSAIKAYGGKVEFIEGAKESHKLTFQEDFAALACLTPPNNAHFVGQGIDFHSFEEGKKMVLGGVELDYPFGFKAHSDGDVMLHALTDAILGAIGGGDIGEWFPDNDSAYKNADSKVLLKKVVAFAQAVGYEMVNVDLTMICETPRLLNYKAQMKTSVADLLGLGKERVNIKATTTEKMGFLGRGEGAGCSAVINMRYYRWDK